MNSYFFDNFNLQIRAESIKTVSVCIAWIRIQRTLVNIITDTVTIFSETISARTKIGTREILAVRIRSTKIEETFIDIFAFAIGVSLVAVFAFTVREETSTSTWQCLSIIL